MNAYEFKLIREPVTAYEVCSGNNPEAVASYLYDLGLAECQQEHFCIIMLDTRRQILGHSIITKGLVDRSHVHPREVFKIAIAANSSCILLAHNHPTGDTTPSKQDLDVTNNLTEVGQLVGIPVIDHIIVGYNLHTHQRNFLSLKETGHI